MRSLAWFGSTCALAAVVATSSCGRRLGEVDDAGTSSSDGSTIVDAGACEVNQQGCPCPSAGQTAACWTGPSSQRHTGGCKDGTTTCQQLGEFEQTWGPCSGEVLTCGEDIHAPSHRIAAGWQHACALTPAGGVKCWGSNLFGQLGNGLTDSMSNWTTKLPPVDVIGLSSGAVDLTAGEDFSCALMMGGGLKCWGIIPGTGNMVTPSPVDIPGLGPISQVAAGEEHVCVMLSAGGVECWGDGGEMNTTTAPSLTSPIPTPVEAVGSDVVSIASGDGYSCALTSGGTLSCWGGNTHGELGSGSLTPADSPTPLAVTGIGSDARALATLGGCQTCAVLTGGRAVCWGWNNKGQLGNGTMTDSPTPIIVHGLESRVTAIAAGGEWGACALLDGGGVFCWGDNSLNQLGSGSTIMTSPVEIAVSGLGSGVKEIAIGDAMGCAIMAAGGVKCWGEYDDPTPVDIPGL
jgi:alpha-tubulin suppressor-like RCC1 family protein